MKSNKSTIRKDLQLFETLSDREVITRILAGDHPLYELIMRRYNRRLFRLAYAILGDDSLAQDAVQETYVSAFQHLNQFRGPNGFGAWLTCIASRIAFRIARKESGLHTVSLIDNESIGPEQVSINDEMVRMLEKAVDSLPRDYRTVLMLREFEGLSTDETAKALDLNPATVKTRLHRAKGILRTRYKHRLDEVRSLAYPFAGTR
ncbi:MAG: sigma-70 family RNA polymerase sigma factor, partial [Candidatus Thiodiazotropha sp. (ex Cardiolucina cf. quadrata)]|nr:sigma-70 family RNA polymerase sigma factor [Candidatus Thiodiazotropha sp. (ex Cardiolucina cf. quadrata)]